MHRSTHLIMPTSWHYNPKGRIERQRDRCWVVDPRKLCLWSWVLNHLPLFCPSAHRGARAGWAGPAATAGLQGGASHQCHVHRELKGGPPVPGRGTHTRDHTGVSKGRIGRERGIRPQSWLPTESSRGDRERLRSQCQPCFVIAGSCQKDSKHHPSQCELRTARARKVPFKWEAWTPWFRLCDCCFAWKLIWCILGNNENLFNFFKKKGKKTEIKQNIKPPCPTRSTFV